MLDDQFIAKNQIGEKLKILGEKELKDSYWNSVKTEKAILPGLIIGNEQLIDVQVGFLKELLEDKK